MFDNNIKRVGFACKYMHADRSLSKSNLKIIESQYNGTSTTRAWLNRQTEQVALDKIAECIDINLTGYESLVNYVSTLDPGRRMLRLGSDVLPFYTESKWGNIYYDDTTLAAIEKRLSAIGAVARANDVKLSMHPGQFTVLASDRPKVALDSIKEVEYHATVATMMGFGKKFQDFKINVHISGKLGPAGVKHSLKFLSPEARNMLTIENEEMKWGLNDTLELADDLALVIDVHHCWINEHEYLQPSDDRVKRVIASWRGVRPTMHYSLSREDILVDHVTDVMPDMPQLLETGYKRGKLRAHSDRMWNTATNEYVSQFWDNFDIMVEAKHKNLASGLLYDQFTA
jgi:UV DNA damage endonuclease